MASPPKKTRLDKLLVDRGLAPSRQRAQAFVMAGSVLVNDRPAAKPGALVDPQARLEVKGPDHPYVSRGGLKLVHALTEFSLDPSGRHVLDIGASTGGFTDCLLQNGAARVTAVDVGYGQLDWKLRSDERVTVLERTNSRHLRPDQVIGPVEAVTADVSFISLTIALAPALEMLVPGGWLAALIKPQFEAERGQVGKGGVIRDEAVRRRTIDKIETWLVGLGFEVLGVSPSPILGPKGNQEYLIGAIKGSRARAEVSPEGEDDF